MRIHLLHDSLHSLTAHCSLCLQRVGHEARMQRENAPSTSAGLTACMDGGAGYLADAERFHTDTVNACLLPASCCLLLHTAAQPWLTMIWHHRHDTTRHDTLPYAVLPCCAVCACLSQVGEEYQRRQEELSKRNRAIAFRRNQVCVYVCEVLTNPVCACVVLARSFCSLWPCCCWAKEKNADVEL